MEAWMLCPVDGATLVMTERFGIEIDYCPKCRGVWLDRGELDKIIERALAEADAPAARPARAPEPAYAPPPPQAAAPVYQAEPGRRAPDSYAQQQPPRRRDDDDDDDYRGGYKKKRRESFLSELFDF